MKKVFVTGGCGFIGRNVIERMLSRGIEVVSFDLVDGPPPLDGEVRRRGTIMDKTDLTNAMRGCDSVLHLAAVIGVKKATEELLNCLNVNITGTVNVLEAAVLAGIGDVLITSSSEVFGDAGDGRYSEEAPFNPKSAYAVSKLAGEEYALGFAREFGITHRVVRFFNVYGPRQSPYFVMPLFAERAAARRPIRVYGEGSQIRAFCHVRDAAEAVARTATMPAGAGETFNIGNDAEPVSMLNLAMLFAEEAGLNESFVEKVPFEETDRTAQREIYRRMPNVDKARRVLGYDPSITLRDGVRELIESYR